MWAQSREDVPTVLSHETALTLHGLSDANPTKIHITIPRRFRLRREIPSWLAVHRDELNEHERNYIDGLPVTTVERTLRDIAEAASPVILQAALRDARRKGLKIPEELNRANG